MSKRPKQRLSSILKNNLLMIRKIAKFSPSYFLYMLIIGIIYPITVINVNVLTGEEFCSGVECLFRTILLGMTDKHSAATVCIPLVSCGYVGEYVKLCGNDYVFHLNGCISPLAADNTAAEGIKRAPKRGNNDR